MTSLRLDFCYRLIFCIKLLINCKNIKLAFTNASVEIFQTEAEFYFGRVTHLVVAVNNQYSKN